MINLLPTDTKQNLLYARRNTKLLHMLTAGFIIIAGIGLVTAFGYVYIRGTVKDYSAQVDQTRMDLKTQKVDEVQKQIESVSGNLKLVVQVLSKEILFSKLLRQMGAAIPQNAVLSGVEISKVEGGIDLAFLAKDYQSATQVQVNLQDPNNKIFEKVDILNIQCASPNAGNSQNSSATETPANLNRTYPCTAQFRALFGKNSPYRLVGNDAKAAKP